ncbi:MAG: anti-sigma factor [Acidobacteriota bacterium]
MKCKEGKELLNSYADCELDLVSHLQIEQHIKECPECRRAHENILAMRSAMTDDSFYFKASADLKARLRSSLKESKPELPRSSLWNWRWMPVFASALLLVGVSIVALTLLRPARTGEDMLAKEMVSAHIRSMMTDGHLMDMPSTDQHTVKPWFDGKLDFAPSVNDLAAQGFPLTGGRLDYIDGHPVAALIYQRRKHVINLFIYPTPDADSQNRVLDRQGYNVIHWNKTGMSFWAVSDVNVGDLQEFSSAVQK